MHAGSWHFPGSTLIHLCPVWGQEGLRPTGNLVIANYISKAFCCCSLLLPPAPLSWLPWVVTSSCLLLLPRTIRPTPPPRPQHWSTATEVASRQDNRTWRGACFLPPPRIASSQLSRGICYICLIPARLPRRAQLPELPSLSLSECVQRAASPSHGSQRTSSALLPKGPPIPTGCCCDGSKSRRGIWEKAEEPWAVPSPLPHSVPAEATWLRGRVWGLGVTGGFGPGVATSLLGDLGGSLRLEVLIYKGRVGSDQGRLSRGPQSPRIFQDGFGTMRLELWV